MYKKKSRISSHIIPQFDLHDQYRVFQYRRDWDDQQHFSFPRNKERCVSDFIQWVFTFWKARTNASRSVGFSIHFDANNRSSFVNAVFTGLLGEGVQWDESIKCNFEPSIIWWSRNDPSCNGLPFRTNFCWLGGIFNWFDRRDLTSWIVSSGETYWICKRNFMKWSYDLLLIGFLLGRDCSVLLYE